MCSGIYDFVQSWHKYEQYETLPLTTSFNDLDLKIKVAFAETEKVFCADFLPNLPP